MEKLETYSNKNLLMLQQKRTNIYLNGILVLRKKIFKFNSSSSTATTDNNHWIFVPSVLSAAQESHQSALYINGPFETLSTAQLMESRLRNTFYKNLAMGL